MAAPAAPPPPGPAQPMPPPAYGPPPPMMYAPPPAQHTALPVAGGALLLVAGLLGLIFWGMFIAAGTTASGMIPIGGDAFASIIMVCGAIGLIFSLIALLGGVFAIQRKMWGLGIAGGILGLFSLGYFLGSILALIGLILIAVSHKEFH